MPVFISVTQIYAVIWAANCFVGSEIPKRNAFNIIDKNLKSLNSISNIFQETQYFLVLKDSVIICIYLRKSRRKSLWEKTPTDIAWPGNVCHPISTLLKCDLAQKLNIFWDYLWQIFSAGKASYILD